MEEKSNSSDSVVERGVINTCYNIGLGGRKEKHHSKAPPGFTELSLPHQKKNKNQQNKTKKNTRRNRDKSKTWINPFLVRLGRWVRKAGQGNGVKKGKGRTQRGP